ncbi:biotin--[acetyl-CoA-carboxylase] ligase [Blattabacterium cuenoti]|uniref:biotin--[acetyl-CoA-carboxylase] ligase n=1 Tax=Blattabacterium cuenoti TaxID=1653831 RepID=UPI00163CAA8A|nr:biotin--[acetyl-CoA-carboxylase] ligase [Blattabacterium cuenoti]
MNKLIWPINLIQLDRLTSTNKYAAQYIISNIIKNWTIINVINQTNGKGTNNNHWYSEKGKNLTFSIILESSFLHFMSYFFTKVYIHNIIICNAIHKILFYYTNHCWIKWPNDIILYDKKIVGILIENNITYNSKKYIIIGIGFNVNQILFDPKLKTSSLRLFFKIKFNLKSLLLKIISFIQKEYLYIYMYNTYSHAINYYNTFLYKRNQMSYFIIKRKNHKIVKYYSKGIIKNITNNGHLIIKINNNKKLFFFSKNDIKFLF